ncbi:hypothetical protein GOBAR_DD17024 [Gossypium barbadense]|nr:hypothetical protein GOBAR_DD17024 [Gossypium barbadense]
MNLSSVCGIPLMDDLGNYLGVLIFHKRLTKESYTHLMDRVMKKLGDWKGELSRRAALEINVVPLPIMDRCHTPDNVCWGLESDGKYSVGSAYNVLTGLEEPSVTELRLDCICTVQNGLDSLFGWLTSID